MKHFLQPNNLNELYRFAYALAGEPQEAEDLLHSSIERALKAGLKAVEHKNAYVRTIIRNHWYDELRKKKVRQDHAQQTLDEEETVFLLEPDPEQVMMDEIQLERCWKELSEQQRELLYLWCILGMSAAEIADELSLSRGTILSRLHRLQGQLQQVHSQKVQHD